MHDIHMMKYDQEMDRTDSEQWNKSVQEEHDCMGKHKVWRAVPE